MTEPLPTRWLAGQHRARAKLTTTQNDLIARVLESANVKFVREYKFHPTRRWRFDFAFPDYMIAIEFQGGQYTRGRHTRPVGFGRDCEKLRHAAILGWRVLLYTTNDLRKFGIWAILDDLRAAGIDIDTKFTRHGT